MTTEKESAFLLHGRRADRRPSSRYGRRAGQADADDGKGRPGSAATRTWDGASRSRIGAHRTGICAPEVRQISAMGRVSACHLEPPSRFAAEAHAARGRDGGRPAAETRWDFSRGSPMPRRTLIWVNGATPGGSRKQGALAGGSPGIDGGTWLDKMTIGFAKPFTQHDNRPQGGSPRGGPLRH